MQASFAAVYTFICYIYKYDLYQDMLDIFYFFA